MMFVDQILWDQENDLNGNYAKITSSGYTLDDVEDILLNPRNVSSYLYGSSLSGITSGITSSGKLISVIWEIECGNPLHIYPVMVYPYRGDPGDST